MPRKQRFKPSRKPKPVDATVEETTKDRAPSQTPRDDKPETEPTRQEASGHAGEIESAAPPRSRDDTSSVIEDVGSEAR